MLVSRIRARLVRRRIAVAAFEQNVAEALASPVVIMRDTWHRGIGGIAVPVSNGSEIGTDHVPVATSSVSEKEMRGALSDEAPGACRTPSARPRSSPGYVPMKEARRS